MVRTSNCFTTRSGKKFYPLEPRPEDICIEDIAHALAHVCRFAGHAKHFFSVAQHSVYVSLVVRSTYEAQLWALLHDASEAYLGDIVRPFKQTSMMEGYRVVEAGVMRAICERFCLPAEEPSIVRTMDQRMYATEVPWVHPLPAHCDPRPPPDVPPLPVDAWPDDKRYETPHQGGWFFWHPPVAKREFLKRFGELMDGLANERSYENRLAIAASSVCGCFHCAAIFQPGGVTEWVDGGQTALCPFCHVDTVLGDASMDISSERLWALRGRWFGTGE
jgi:uncharacterized protein